MKIKKAIIPAAGFGTRFLPATKALPKVMLPVVDKPAVHYLAEEAAASGIEQIIIVTGPNGRIIADYFSKSAELEEHLAKTGRLDVLDSIQRIAEMAEINYVRQNKALGLGHAIYCARRFIAKNETFAVLLGDIIIKSAEPCLKQLISVFTNYPATIIGAQNVPAEEVSYHGIIKGNSVSDRLFKVQDLVEKPALQAAPSNLAIAGRYLIPGDIFGILKNTKPGYGGEIQLTDALKELTGKQDTFAYIFEGVRYDIGSKMGFLRANLEFALQQPDIRERYKKYLHDLIQDAGDELNCF